MKGYLVIYDFGFETEFVYFDNLEELLKYYCVNSIKDLFSCCNYVSDIYEIANSWTIFDFC